MTLPPGQRAVEGFPRFGTHFSSPPPDVPADPAIEISGSVREQFSVPLTDLATLPRRQITADFHCVAGWSATDLEWEGVGFETFYRLVIEPKLAPGVAITHVVFEGLDRYRSIVEIEDALGEDVLLADRLDGRPLDPDHGAPVRLVSPSQYGFISTKHLCHIEVHTSRPKERYHADGRIQMRLQVVKPHRRARVWHEERHRYLPAKLLRPIYRRLTGPIATWSARGSRKGPLPPTS